MKKLLLLGLCALLGVGSLKAQEQQEEQPLLRVALMSDIHNELTMISNSDQTKLRLRPTFLTSLQKVKEMGGVDVLALTGDFTSDCTISESNWQRIREMMAEAARGCFASDAARRPIIWVAGNHEYEVANFDNIPKPYNAGDYYSFPMREDMGELTEAECFYETADNGNLGTMRLLAAYHYVTNGFDFVVINCGKYFFRSAWDYQLSQESVNWVDQKLAELTADDPNRTIFVIGHLPLPSSVGATSNKTLSKSAQSSYNLERALAKYPGIIYLYGHDHSSRENKSFYESSLLQRLTFYDTNGNVIEPYGIEVGGSETGGETPVTPPTTPERLKVYIRSTANNKYLSYDTHNAAINDTPNAYEVYPSTSLSGACVIYGKDGATDSQGVQHYIHCGSSGRFSGNTELSNNSTHYFYEITNTATGEGTHVTQPEAGKTYAIVTLSSKGGYYALSNEMYQPGSASQRIVGVSALNPTSNETQTFTASNVFWTLEEVTEGGGEGGGTTEPVDPTPTEQIKANFQSLENDKYLGFDTYNLTTRERPNLFTVAPSAKATNTFTLFAPNGPTAGNGYLYCGSSGRFSGNSAISTNSSILFYEVDPTTMVGTRTNSPEFGKTYALVALSTSGGYYVLTNTAYQAGSTSQRLYGVSCTNADTQTFTTKKALWLMTEHEEDATVPGDASYMSAFVGSMRYNNLDTNSSPNENDPRIIQTLIVELYPDHILLTLKNTGETGTIIGNAVTANINAGIKSYLVEREVHGTKAPDTYIVTGINSEKTCLGAYTGRIYSLSGQIVGSSRDLSKLPAGVYIVNGRKVVK